MRVAMILVLSLLILGGAAPVPAQDAAELGLRHASVQQASIDQLKQYTWQTDTKLIRDGEAKVHVVLESRLNEKGEMVQKVETAETTVRAKRGLRGRAQAQHAGEVGEFIDHVVARMASYIFLSKGQEVDFFDKATITEGAGGDAGKLLVQATGVAVPGD